MYKFGIAFLGWRETIHFLERCRDYNNKKRVENTDIDNVVCDLQYVFC